MKYLKSYKRDFKLNIILFKIKKKNTVSFQEHFSNFT